VEFVKIVDTDTPIPGLPSATFDDLSVPAIYGGRVAFSGRSGEFHNQTQAGAFLAEDGALAIIADLQTFMPGGQGSTFYRFGPPSVERDRVCFHGANPFDHLEEGIYAKRGNKLRVVVDVHTLVPGQTGTFTSQFSQLQSSADGNGAFISWNGEHTGVYTEIGGALGVVANRDTAIPGGEGNFTPDDGAPGFEGVSISGSEVAFGGRGVGQEGIYSTVGGPLRVEADRHTMLPGATGLPGTLRGPALNRGNVAFYAGSQFGEGIFARIGSAMQIVADRSTPVPDRGVNFLQFEPFTAIERRNVVFWGRPDPGISFAGIYVRFFGELMKVIETDDTLEGRDVAFVTFGPQAISGNRVAFKVTFSDFSQGLYVAILRTIFRDGFESGDLTIWSSGQ
jgi:hypothetical protein